ncbi:MAG: penicillin-binding protein 1C [Candidatus Eremiobacteraeota bacterium]|nr:penicillin-binding protein 1C [Candidatus Eremiobacteraeota bacterium]
MKHFGTAVAFCVPALVAGIASAAYAIGIDVAALPAQREAVTYTDRNGIALGTVLASDASHAVAVPLTRVSPAFLRAIVAAEDARFYHHGALDVAALARAARDFAIFGEARSGGSTIEMQLARLLHPSPGTVRGKLSQILRAERIAIRSSKTAILEAYVNRVPMGGNVYGVEAAARTYFGEPAADLDLAQASLLAAIPNDPAHLAPGVDWRALRRRQQYVLARMTELGEIGPEQSKRAFAETLHVREHDTGIADAAHALFFLHSQGLARAGRMRTTIDRGLQRFVQAQTEDVVGALRRYHVTDAAALVVDNRTAEVLAYVGSPDYFADDVLGRNDGVQALRQPGSSLKPFTYELALETGTIRSTTILPDVPAAYALPGGRLYQPADYSGRFSGPVRVRYALANSLNVPAVRVLSSLGVGTLLDRLRELRFRHLDQTPAYYGLGLTLGAGEVSLWELVQAYSTMARGGAFVPLHLTDSAAVPAVRRIGDAGTWALVGDILADAHARAHSFGAHSVLEMPFWAAVKTGTSSDFRDTWTIGYTREYTVGVWVGNFDGTPMRGVSGVTGAGPLWNRIMLHLHEDAEPPPYPPPPGFVRATICASTGQAPTPGCGAVVEEWVLRRDLASIERPAPLQLGNEYSPWLAGDPALSNARTVRIVNPEQGAVFVRNPVNNALQDREQRIALRAIGARAALRWSANGAPLPSDASGTAFFPLRLGTWTLAAQDGRSSDRVTIEVIERRATRAGFTFSRAPARYWRYRR